MKKKNYYTNDEIMVTDLLANLCTELASVFSSLSRITKTCLGLKDQLITNQLESDPLIQNPVEEVKETCSHEWKKEENQSNNIEQ